MKRLLYAAVLAVVVLTACKPNEAAYRAAYESTLARRDSLTALDETIYSKYRQMARNTRIALGNDTLEVVTERIGFTEDGGAERDSVQRYNVVVGRFKQVFNARQMRERLVAQGYPGAFVVHTREPLYYVVATTWSTAQGALEGLREVEADGALHLKAPLPFVLEAAHLRR